MHSTGSIELAVERSWLSYLNRDTLLPSSGKDGGDVDLLMVVVLATCSDGVSPQIIVCQYKRLF